MKLKSNIDFGKAFDCLKDALRDSDTIKENKDDILSYARAYATLAGSVEGIINNVSAEPEETGTPTLDRHLNNPDDIPDHIYRATHWEEDQDGIIN